jgi:hypothetical protein
MTLNWSPSVPPLRKKNATLRSGSNATVGTLVVALPISTVNVALVNVSPASSQDV